MKDIISVFKSIMIIILILLSGCNNDSDPEGSDMISNSYITASGDINESYGAVAYFGIATYTSFDVGKEYLSITLYRLTSEENDLTAIFMFKSGSELPAPGSYDIGQYAIGDDMPPDVFGGAYCSGDVSDYSSYHMTSGTLTINESSDLKISGEIDMSGHYAELADEDTSRTVSITGEFIATPSQSYGD